MVRPVARGESPEEGKGLIPAYGCAPYKPEPVEDAPAGKPRAEGVTEGGSAHRCRQHGKEAQPCGDSDGLSPKRMRKRCGGDGYRCRWAERRGRRGGQRKRAGASRQNGLASPCQCSVPVRARRAVPVKPPPSTNPTVPRAPPSPSFLRSPPSSPRCCRRARPVPSARGISSRITMAVS